MPLVSSSASCTYRIVLAVHIFLYIPCHCKAYKGVRLSHFPLLPKIGSVNLYSNDDCLRKFDSNHHLGALLFAGIVISVLLKKTDDSEDSAGAPPYRDD